MIERHFCYISLVLSTTHLFRRSQTKRVQARQVPSQSCAVVLLSLKTEESSTCPGAASVGRVLLHVHHLLCLLDSAFVFVAKILASCVRARLPLLTLSLGFWTSFVRAHSTQLYRTCGVPSCVMFLRNSASRKIPQSKSGRFSFWGSLFTREGWGLLSVTICITAQ